MARTPRSGWASGAGPRARLLVDLEELERDLRDERLDRLAHVVVSDAKALPRADATSDIAATG
jgi:hypothetical protein